jgi:2-amino-4-hydroxy-6-hydroxymethyldihydropteridine diphosphokinase
LAIVYLGLGSNVDAESNLHRAVAALREQFDQIELSPVYRSSPLGFDGDDFLNLVVRFSTDQAPDELLDYFETLHERAGRVRGHDKLVSRPLDIDLLLYGDVIDPEPPLRLPRSDILEHSFVLRPLAELAPDLVHPVTGSTMKAIWNEFDPASHPLQAVDVVL